MPHPIRQHASQSGHRLRVGHANATPGATARSPHASLPGVLPGVLPGALPGALTRRLAALLRLNAEGADRLQQAPATRLDSGRIRLEVHSPRRRWNVAYLDLKEGNILLARMQPGSLHVRLEGEMRGPAALNLGDALLEGLHGPEVAPGRCRRFVLDFACVKHLGEDALQLVALLWQELARAGCGEGLAAGIRGGLRLMHGKRFPELRRAAPASCF
ncbi:hypothetical protein [Megalodesulfovibrio paquesii]